MKLEYYGCSQTGSVREINEDAVLMCASDDAALFLVADGIGGKEHGEVISGMLRNRYRSWWEDNFQTACKNESFFQYLEEIKTQLEWINYEVIKNYGEFCAGSTIVLLFLLGDTCAYISSGDSRIYKIRGLNCQQITRDDIFDNLPEERAARYDSSTASGKLVGAVGISNRLDFSVRTDILHTGDCIFLCSDGVYRYIQSRKLKKRLVFDQIFLSQERLAAMLCADIEKNGSGDNYSFILVRVR